MSQKQGLDSGMEADGYASTVGLGYGIAMAVGIMALVSSVMLASYLCVRVHGRRTSATARRREAGNSSARAANGASSADGDGESELEVEEGANGAHSRGGGDCTVAMIGGVDDEASLESYPKLESGSSEKNKKKKKKKKKKMKMMMMMMMMAVENKACCAIDQDHHGGDESLCSICLAGYRDGELVRMLPDCGHRFHTRCVDEWLRSHASCPICRAASPLPTPGSTPLSSLIPIGPRSPPEPHFR